MFYDDGEPPWGEDGDEPSYDICLCCGAEFGFDDYTIELIRGYRQKWIDTGAKWAYPEFRPEDWNLEKQLEHIPVKFR